jgi:hypothetical protein
MGQATFLGGRSLLAFSLTLFLVATLAGCGGPKVGQVSGTVTYQNKPLPNGTVTFLGPDNKGDSANIDNGSYTASKVPVGSCKVTVSTSASSGAPKPVAVPGVPPPPEAVPIPGKYSKPESSGLTLEVKTGGQTFDIPLQP